MEGGDKACEGEVVEEGRLSLKLELGPGMEGLFLRSPSLAGQALAVRRVPSAGERGMLSVLALPSGLAVRSELDAERLCSLERD